MAESPPPMSIELLLLVDETVNASDRSLINSLKSILYHQEIRRGQSNPLSLDRQDPGLLKETFAMFEQVQARHLLQVAPKYMSNIKDGIKNQLNTYILQYISELDGIPLTYGRFSISSGDDEAESGAILYENPCVQVVVNIPWVLFCPRKGCKLRGRVVMWGEEHIALLVLDYFSATISAPHMGASLFWEPESQTWMLRKSKKKIEAGSFLDFIVVNLSTGGQMIMIDGSIDQLIV